MLFTACAGASGHGGPAPASSLPPLPPPDPSAARGDRSIPVAVSDARDPDLAPPDRVLHDQARAYARGGKVGEAKRLLGRLATAYPTHQVLVDQYNEACALLETARTTAKASLVAAPLRTLPPPPAVYTLAREAPITGTKTIPTLVKKSEKKNAITDEEKWFADIDAHLSEYFVPPPGDLVFAPGAVQTSTVVNTLTGFAYTEYVASGMYATENLPVEVPLAYGTMPLTRAIRSATQVVAIYGQRVIAVFDDGGSVAGLFDLASFRNPPANVVGSAKVGDMNVVTADGRGYHADVQVRTDTIVHDVVWALTKGGVLYVSTGNLGYAKESKGQNAYVTAIDLAAGTMLWRSAPLVSNARAFAMVGDAVVTGYGFTAEPDFLYVLDRTTGVAKQKIPLATGPDYVVVKDNRVLVRTYDTNYVFEVK